MGAERPRIPNGSRFQGERESLVCSSTNQERCGPRGVVVTKIVAKGYAPHERGPISRLSAVTSPSILDRAALSELDAYVLHVRLANHESLEQWKHGA